MASESLDHAKHAVAKQKEKIEAAQDLARQLMAHHGLNRWAFRFNRRKRQMGICFYPNQGKPGRIELSLYFVVQNSNNEIHDTILHEIAHALVGPRHAHDAYWKAKCVEIGAIPRRCGHAEMPIGSWRATCPGCKKNFHRHRRPKRTKRFYCRACGPHEGSIVWEKAQETDRRDV